MLINQSLSASKDGTNVHGRAMQPTQHIDERRHQPTERAKVAPKRSFPLLEFTIHMLSLGVIGTLLWVHLTGAFWTDFEPDNQRQRNMELKAWQFAAKLHELLMLSSLSFIVFYYMRKLLVGRNGIPFGLVSAPHLISSPNILFTSSFWVGWSRHLPFGGLLFLACIFSFTLGPCSAITMIPSLGWYEMDAFPANGSTILYNATISDIWPSVFRSSMDTFDPDGCLLHLFGSSVQRKVDIATGYDQRSAWAYTTVISELSSRTLGAFYYYARHNNSGGTGDTAYPRLRITADTPVQQPVVYVKCSLSYWEGESDQGDVPFPLISTLQAWGQETLQPPLVHMDSDDEIFNGLPSEDARFLWYKGSGANVSSSLLAMAIVPVEVKNSTGDRYASSAIVACSTDARWAASDAYYQPMNSTIVSSNVSDTLFEAEWVRPESLITKYGISEKPLDLQHDWASFLNGNQTTRNADNSSSSVTSMALLLNAAISRRESDDGDTARFYVPHATTQNRASAIEEAIAMLIGTVLADGIARSTSDIDSLLKTNAKADYDVVTRLETHRYPGHRLFKWRPDRYVSGLYSVRIELDSYGYGYGLRNTAVWAAMIILLLFTLVVLVHVAVLGYDIATRQYYGGKCWEDVAGLMALAMNSTPSEKLDGTSAGVDLSATWRNVVKIRETDGQRLELRFIDRKDEDEGRVVLGKAYL